MLTSSRTRSRALLFLFALAAIPFEVATFTGCPLGPVECVREVTCVDACGGTPFSNGCDACPEGTIDTVDCPADCGECLRAVECVTACGAAPVQTGCCPCPEGTFDSISCDVDGGSDGG
jgi:hypothetical protein